MKKNEDGSITLSQKDVNLGNLQCEVPACAITRYEFYILSHSDSSSLLKFSDVFLKMFLGFLLQLVVSMVFSNFDEDIAGHRMDAFQYVSMGLCFFLFLSCWMIAKLKGTERTRVINNIRDKFNG